LIRAFLALETPTAVKERLAAAREELRRELPKARWTRPEGWHLTLKFLGEVEAATLEVLTGALAPRLHGLGPVAVRLGGAGFFPSPARPREAVEAAGEAAGFPRERRPWAVHVTLARLKARWPVAAVDRFLKWGEEFELEPFECREVVLFESDLQPGGAVYTAIERLSLA